MASQNSPFYLTIAPASPHVNEAIGLTIPLKRHMGQFANLTVPKPPSFNPSDEIQKQKPAYMPGLTSMNDTEIQFSDLQYQYRAEALLGVDEIIEDVVNFLEEKDLIDNTYSKEATSRLHVPVLANISRLVIYTSANGYHIGTFRLRAGKSMGYIDDTNLPLVVRGPGVPEGQESSLPSTHVDLPPTILDLARLPRSQWPPFFDGRSLASDWMNPLSVEPGQNEGNGREMVNIEFWGVTVEEVVGGVQQPDNSYKTIRVVGENLSWYFSVWCTNEMELYNTTADPFELHNLANSTDPAVQRVKSRLNAMLLLTKSCTEDSCRDPWAYLQPNGTAPGTTRFSTLKEALDPQYDAWFGSFPSVHWNECLQIQLPSNEVPFYPASAQFALGSQYRENTDYFCTTNDRVKAIPANGELQGGPEQRNATLAQIMAQAYAVPDDLLGVNGNWIRATNGLIPCAHP